MSIRRSVVLLISIICLTSCASSRRARHTDAVSSIDGHTRLIAHPREVVWSAIQAYMAARNWPVSEADQSQGTIRSKAFHLDNGRDYAHCRTGRRSAVAGYEAKLGIELHRLTANGTNVTIDTRITAVSDGSTNADCSSTGALEDELVAGVDSIVAAWRK